MNSTKNFESYFMPWGLLVFNSFFLVCLFLTVLLAFSTLLNCLIDPKNDRLFYIKFFQHKIKLHRFNKLLKRIFLHIHYKWTTMKSTILYAVFPAAFTKEDVLHNNLLTIIKKSEKNCDLIRLFYRFIFNALWHLEFRKMLAH